MIVLADGAHQHGAGPGTSASAAVPVLALLLAGYAYAAALAGQPPGPGSGGRATGRTPVARVVAWYAGLGVVAVAVFSPLAGNHAASAHMLRHELLLTVAPLLLVAGLDRRVTLPLTRTAAASALRTGVGRRGLAVLASPVAATALWVAVALGGHLPAVSDAVLADGRLHAAQQIILIAAGVVFWTAVLGRLPSAHRVTVGQQIGALGVAMAAGGLVAAPLAWSNAVVHPGADPWFGLSPVQDQQLAAVLMMALDMPVLLGALVWVVARWAQRQASPTVGPDAVAASVPDGA